MLSRFLERKSNFHHRSRIDLLQHSNRDLLLQCVFICLDAIAKWINWFIFRKTWYYVDQEIGFILCCRACVENNKNCFVKASTCKWILEKAIKRVVWVLAIWNIHTSGVVISRKEVSIFFLASCPQWKYLNGVLHLQLKISILYVLSQNHPQSLEKKIHAL